MIKIILIIMAVFILYCMIETARELRDFRLTKYRICSPKLNGIRETKKIVFLSDLHNRMYGKEMNAYWKASKPTSGSDPDRRGYVGQKGWQFI